MARYLSDFCVFIRRRIYLISWISLILYLFYKSFIFYLNGRQFYYLRRMLGLGLCVSRGTATVLNLCCALVLVPLCKKLNQVLYRAMSKLCPGLFFFWLERAKSFHMTVAITLVMFAVVHSVSHFVNLWNFSRNYDEEREEINMASYKNQSPLRLLMSVAGVTGTSMLIIVLSMGVTSTRFVRRRVYNAFWYTHQLYLPFMLLLMIHPLSGVLKEEVFDENSAMNTHTNVSSQYKPKFAPIKSMTWLWMALPLICFFLDLLWRIFSRNLARVRILNVSHMAGRTISLTLSCPHEQFSCRKGQYILMQCLDVSVLEWHPFTAVEIPTQSQRLFVIWIKVKGDWTESLEKLINERGPNNLTILIDGPFSSPMEGVCASKVAICIAAGVGITPFVSVLKDLLINPRSRLPGRIHLIWIVRHESELIWIAKLANDTIMQLRNANRPDRLHLELYVTNTNEIDTKNENKYNKARAITHIVVDDKGTLSHVIDRSERNDNDEKTTLLTPHLKRNGCVFSGNNIIKSDKCIIAQKYNISKKYPLVGCRVKRGRPHWDRVFGYWIHLYPEEHLNLYCCGPKKLVKMLRSKCKYYSSRLTKTRFTFIHEGFS
ncbi:NADPH oxidase 4-like [Maniola jurtina]|uniref:NADPH oxidase 4-like n=1 Tax=Maniola jurtina TaxID=191418 RepID=UPI001E68A5F3|nr:NADPH oxidase 4-like [Maniola jurtina]